MSVDKPTAIAQPVADSASTEPEPARSGGMFPIVGVGASAGGLEALTQLLQALPATTGMGFVVVQHLAPDHESSLAEILARAAKIPVCEVGAESAVEPDHVYVIPPGRDMVIAGGRLRLLPQERRARHRGIDQFFRSLAEDLGHLAIGVVLSGSASDGTLGLEAIKAEGGITFAQDESAQFDSMPLSAVASGFVDFVLAPEAIAGEIARIARHPYLAREPEIAAEEKVSHARIAQIVQRATGVDFTHYKANTLHRRISRRMMLHKMETLRDYEEHLKRQPEEVEALYQDILINVTSFFRDPEAFDLLSRKVFPKLLANRSLQEPMRIWTIGCSTGEEAYSLAITFAECAEAAGSQVPLQLFATDLNSFCVAKARAGLYSKNIAQDISPERLQRFFIEEDGGYRICKPIREQCIFSRHNVLSDPPFSRIDLVSCRNLLIYLEPRLQQQIVPVLHYALKPDGFLWLGNSETVGGSRALFEPEDARHKLYSRRPRTSPPPRPSTPRAGDSAEAHFPPQDPRRQEPPRADLHKEAERILLTKFAPPGVVISSEMEILQFRGETGAYLAPAAGTPSLHLLKMLREGLLAGVRTAILQSGKDGRTVRQEGLRVKGESGFREIAIEVIPIKSARAKESGFLVLFDEGTGSAAKDGAQAASSPDNAPVEGEVSRLHQELAATRDYLQSIIEQQEAANEELQTANEEAQSANEEMQSVNEELETSKEEIQSSNEELATVNEELDRLNHSLRLARDYAENIAASVRVPLLVLNGQLRVKTASHAFYECFLTTPGETVGRLIYELGNRQWNIPALRTLFEEILPKATTIDGFEVHHRFDQIGERIMLLRAARLAQMPGSEPLIVLSVEDITERTKAEEALRASATELARADRSKDEFLAMLAHELRNPLAPLRNAAEILNTAGGDAEERVQAERILIRQIENMSRMIDDLLDVSRITEGKIELRRHPVPLADILTAATSGARSSIAAREQKLTVSLPAEPVFLNADATRLEQVFSNLLGNACKYSGDRSHISLSAELAAARPSEPPEVVVRVSDDGIGIAPELLPRVFDLFVQATRALDRAHGGLGIGLTLVRRLVKMHGGSVEAHSDGIGRGSEFVVRLPVIPGPVSAEPALPKPPRREIPRRMLIVDDNEDSARSMSMLQHLRGHETRTAFSGPAAVAAAAEFVPEVVILDIGLPGMDGYEVVRRLRAMPALAGAFIVAMSGYGSDEDRTRADKAGFDGYLVKPVDLDLLRAWLQDRP